MTDSTRLPRTVRGKRPRFYEAAGVDEVMSMVVALAQEVTVLRERFDCAERVMAKHGVALADEIEALEPDQALLAERERWRQSFYDRLFFVLKQQRAELEEKFTSERYDEVISSIARGD